MNKKNLLGNVINNTRLNRVISEYWKFAYFRISLALTSQEYMFFYWFNFFS
jgi:hypothetical protein